jgi:uncharacterized membrane protein
MSQTRNKKDIVLKNKKGKSNIKSILITAIAGAAVAAALIIFTIGRGNTSQADGMQINENEISFSADLFNDGEAKYFQQEFDGGTVRYFLVQSNDGTVRAAFDACDVCYRAGLGYRQEGGAMVCNNCGQVFPSERINIEKGGCNPAPLEREFRGTNIVLNLDDVERGLFYF